ncbi:hypothetical protein J6590_039187 [Homalodisca vitripennis]|nr:hypothetical protein J6590_039187 [Homalodisca vitripennis]
MFVRGLLGWGDGGSGGGHVEAAQRNNAVAQTNTFFPLCVTSTCQFMSQDATQTSLINMQAPPPPHPRPVNPSSREHPCFSCSLHPLTAKLWYLIHRMGSNFLTSLIPKCPVKAVGIISIVLIPFPSTVRLVAVMNNYQAAAAAAQGYGPPASPHTVTPRPGYPPANSPGPGPALDIYSSSGADSVAGYVQAPSPQPPGFPAIAVSRAPINYNPFSPLVCCVGGGHRVCGCEPIWAQSHSLFDCTIASNLRRARAYIILQD